MAESTLLARDLVNHPSMFMDPEQLAKECEALAEDLGIEVQIYDKKQAEEMNMGRSWPLEEDPRQSQAHCPPL